MNVFRLTFTKSTVHCVVKVRHMINFKFCHKLFRMNSSSSIIAYCSLVKVHCVSLC